MRSTFERQIEPCARNGHSVRPPPVAKANSSPPIPRASYAQSASDCMLEHKTQAAFLKTLIAYEDGEESRQLRDNLANADRERKRLRHALFLMGALFILASAGLSYCALLLPQIFFNPGHFLIKTLSFLGLASLIAQVEFFGYLLWHHYGVNRLHKECRRRVLLRVDSQLRASPRRSPGADALQEPEPALAGAPSNGQEITRKLQTQL